MKKICYIMGAAPVRGSLFTPEPDALVIAADGGYQTLIQHGIRCDLALGDFDSGEKPNFPNTITLNPIKDDTDTLYAVKTALARGYERFFIYGALGGCLSHTIASMQTLTYLLDHGAKGILVGDGYAVAAIRCDRIDFKKECSGYFSVFSFDEISKGVSITGAKYPLEDAVITNGFPIGVSNEFVGQHASVSVCDGTLHVIFECQDPFGAVYPSSLY